MSAFLCSEKHISVLLNLEHLSHHAEFERFTIYHDRAPKTKEEMFRVLVDANLLSLDARYGEGTDVYEGHALRYRPTSKCRTAVEVLKLADSFDYQSCEDDSWPDSLAKEYIDWVREKMISEVPGYDQAPWSI